MYPTHPGILAILVLALFGVSASGKAKSEDCLRTKAGTPLKVIVKKPSALHREPTESSEAEPVEVFRFFYVLPTEPDGDVREQDGFVRVATASKVRREAGWISADSVVFWSHAQVGGFTPLTSRHRILFFETRQQAVKHLECPTCVADDAISREPEGNSTLRFFPLLDVSTVQHNGFPVEIYKVAYLAATGRNTTPGEGELARDARILAATTVNADAPRTRQELSRDFKLQVAFVIDATRSMEPWFAAMLDVMARVVNELNASPGVADRIEFALVCYRDQLEPGTPAAKEMEFVSKIFSDFTGDIDAFRKTIASTRVAEISSEDYPEDVLAGGQMAIVDLSWSKAASRHVVFIGDAPAHLSTDGYKNIKRQTIEGLLTLAQPTGPSATWERKQIHALRIEAEMEAECRDHFARLTAGRDFPGLHYAYAGSDDADKFVADLTQRLSQLAEVTADVAAGRFDKVERRAQDQATDPDLRRLLGPVLPMLRATNESTESRFTEGYCAVLDPEGNRALEPHVLVPQAQLKLFESALNHCVLSLENSGEAGSRDVQKVVQQLQILATGINLKEDVHPDMPLHELLSRVLGFPCRNDVFSMTPRKLAAMTGADFTNWVNQVRASQSICRSHIENTSQWFDLGEGTGRSHEKHAFIKVSDLP